MDDGGVTVVPLETVMEEDDSGGGDEPIIDGNKARTVTRHNSRSNEVSRLRATSRTNAVLFRYTKNPKKKHICNPTKLNLLKIPKVIIPMCFGIFQVH